jgi:uncharacterized membrane protein YfcA
MLGDLPNLFGISWVQLVLIPLAFIVGGTAKGALGFGLPFVTVSIIPLFAPLEIALAVNAVVLPISNFMQFTQSGVIRPTLKRYRLVVFGILVGAPFGAYRNGNDEMKAAGKAYFKNLDIYKLPLYLSCILANASAC